MRRWEDRVKKVEQLAQSFQRNPLTAGYKPRLWPCQPSSIWKLFPRQSMAISFAKSCKEAVHVFALEREKALQGQRMFLVTSYSELWHYYRTYPQSLMHCYEVIPEGAVCKLYFDLEFHKPSNVNTDGKSKVSLLIQFVCAKLMETYGIRCSAQNVLNLDSSTEEKFSRHLIFNLPNAAFKDNIHIGRFINCILDPIQTKRCNTSTLKNSIIQADDDSKTCEGPLTKKQKLEDEDLSFLLVKSKNGEDCLFVDLGVYTKNRNFRLYKSSKMGKNAAFTVADDNEFVLKPEKGVSVEQGLFLASLVCNIRPKNSYLLTRDSQQQNRLESTGLSPKQSFFTFWLLVIPSSRTGPICFNFGSKRRDPRKYVPVLTTYDEHIMEVAAAGMCKLLCVSPKAIRRWNYFAPEQLLVYDIANFRWCQNVNRFHKSNNILIVVDLKEEMWYQKCHDPECGNFRSSSYPLPQEICMSYIMELDEEDQMFLMDDSGNIELSQASAKQSSLSQSASLLPRQTLADNWINTQDDLDLLEGLNAFEQNKEVSDDLLLKCMDDYDAAKGETNP